MSTEKREGISIYKVVVNREEQDSSWFTDREPPLSWKEVGKTWSKRNVWPTSKRGVDRHETAELEKKMAEAESKR